jgi:hypothetical protein
MKMSFEREPRYVVLKCTDIQAACLTEVEIAAFNAVCDKISRSRIERAKGLLECVVVEHDWPEFDPTWEAIERRCTATHAIS